MGGVERFGLLGLATVDFIEAALLSFGDPREGANVLAVSGHDLRIRLFLTVSRKALPSGDVDLNGKHHPLITPMGRNRATF